VETTNNQYRTRDIGYWFENPAGLPRKVQEEHRIENWYEKTYVMYFPNPELGEIPHIRFDVNLVTEISRDGEPRFCGRTHTKEGYCSVELCLDKRVIPFLIERFGSIFNVKDICNVEVISDRVVTL